ncbi:hypothetical protein [Vulcanococcus limneticus]|uniref:hypothetical protein n=1 Tax=Vulcanococcus limneticus TaxID=2170428 RepID=UPI00398C1A7A
MSQLQSSAADWRLIASALSSAEALLDRSFLYLSSKALMTASDSQTSPMTTELGELQAVDIRYAWPSESKNFTPWLAVNLDRLSAELGIDLVLEGTEMPVGPFYADILAVETLSGKRVLIENQLEQTDHSHLGQILTYLAGLEAHTVIWTARKFRDEHLSAIRWLNSHTTEDFSFFAVEITAVRIGSSPIAPLLRVAEKPNDWDRRLQASSLTSLGEKPYQLAGEFWTATLSSYPELQGVARTGPGGSNVWVAIPNSPLVLSLAYSVGAVGWFVRGQKGVHDADVTDLLLPHADYLGDTLGLELNMNGNGVISLQEWKHMDMRNRDNWPCAADWFAHGRQRVLDAFAKCLDQQPDQVQEQG